MGLFNILFGGNEGHQGYNPNREIMDWRRTLKEYLEKLWGGPAPPEHTLGINIGGQTIYRAHPINRSRQRMLDYVYGWGPIEPTAAANPRGGLLDFLGGLGGLLGKFF